MTKAPVMARSAIVDAAGEVISAAGHQRGDSFPQIDAFIGYLGTYAENHLDLSRPAAAVACRLGLDVGQAMLSPRSRKALL